jgi:hypothetical protein
LVDIQYDAAPTYIIEMIFEGLHDLFDAIMLGLAHGDLLAVGWTPIPRRVGQAPAAVTCVGGLVNDLRVRKRKTAYVIKWIAITTLIARMRRARE